MSFSQDHFGGSKDGNADRHNYQIGQPDEVVEQLDDHELIHSYNNQIRRLREKGQHEHALEIAKRLRGLAPRQLLGDNNPYLAITLDNLAYLYQSMGNYAEAEPLYRQALEINRKVLGDEHP